MNSFIKDYFQSGKIQSTAIFSHIKVMSIPFESKNPVARQIVDLQQTGETRIILQYPEITLKGKNQKDFQNTLYQNIKRHMADKGYQWKIGASHGRACIIVPENQQTDTQQVTGILQQMPGVSSLAVTTWLHPDVCLTADGAMDWEVIGKEMVNLARQYYKNDATFAIRVNRTNKSLPATSQEIGVRLGDIIRRKTDWDRVKLSKPDQTFFIDAHPDGLYLYAEKLKGVGGLPVSTGGKVLALLSGGIDSPVAAFLLAKRGCDVDFFHLSASHMREQELKDSVIARLACRLSQYTQRSRLYIVPYTYFDLALSGKTTGYELILFRRFMMRAAEKLAEKIHAQALVNGDSLGQVASQTLENLVSSTRVVTRPILRPLIGSNKEEIIDIARRIGCYDISIEPYKDCCALIAKHPKTKSSHEKLEKIEAIQLPEYDDLLKKSFADMVCLKYQYGKLVNEDDS